MNQTPQERVDDLINRGYIEVPEFGNLSVGARVRHIGEQYQEAIIAGTGNIERIFHKDNPSFEKKYGPDVELIVKRDKPRFGPDDTHTFVADYHVIPIQNYDNGGYLYSDLQPVPNITQTPEPVVSLAEWWNDLRAVVQRALDFMKKIFGAPGKRTKAQRRAWKAAMLQERHRVRAERVAGRRPPLIHKGSKP